MEESNYAHFMLVVAQVFELIAAGVLLAGLIVAGIVALRAWRRSGGREAYRIMRQGFGGAILLGLEILVAGDLIRTVAVSPTLENVAVLGLIVLIRTFLSFSLEIEVSGTVPWRRAMVSGVTVMKDAYSKDAGTAGA